MPDPIHTTTSEAATVAALALKSITPSLNVEGHGLAVFPDRTVKSLDNEQLAAFPKRKRARVSLSETASFINYVNDHKNSGSTHIFGVASTTGGNFTAILDYHSRGSDARAHWGEHECVLTLETTPEWQRWTANNGKQMPQEAFAEFLEDNLSDIVRPDAAELLDMATFLTGKKGAIFKSGKNLKNGAITFEYSETIETTGGRANGDMRVPDKFVLGICPFVGSAGIELEARLRFRISDSGKLSFAYLLNRPHKVVEDAVNFARGEIEEKIGLPVYLGAATVIQPKPISF